MHRLLLVRPCAGHEESLTNRLASRGGADVVILAVESALDPAATSAHRAARALVERGVDARVVHTHARGPNHKVAQLAQAVASYGTALRDEDVIVVADSDVELERAQLYALVTALRNEKVGATWAAPVEAGPIESCGDRVAHAVLGASLHAFPLLAGIDRSGMVGKLFAIRARALADVGGFAPFVDRLGEDVALARALRRHGWNVRVSATLARSVAHARSVTSVVERLARWVHVVRSERPHLLLSYPLLFAPLVVAFAALVSGAMVGDRLLVAAGAVVVASRLAVASGSVSDAIIGDVALLAAFVRALVRPRFAWRGRPLRIGRGGRLLEEGPSDDGEHALGEPREERRAARVESGERSLVTGIDAGELGEDAVPLSSDGRDDRRIVHRSECASDRDPELGRFAARKHVANAERSRPSGKIHTARRGRSSKAAA